ncbi:MAG: hypothetical protein H0X29_00800 [Parachlamydiaceae bacterium]|nr:hypothetical protein [Parachlamydiaceae bacterium]
MSGLSQLSSSSVHSSLEPYQLTKDEYQKKLKELSKPSDDYIADNHIVKAANKIQLIAQRIKGFLNFENKTDPIRVSYEIFKFLQYGESQNYFDDNSILELVKKIKENLNSNYDYREIHSDINDYIIIPRIKSHPIKIFKKDLNNHDQIKFGLRVFKFAKEHDKDLKKTWLEQLQNKFKKQISSITQKFLNLFGHVNVSSELQDKESMLSNILINLKKNDLDSAIELFRKSQFRNLKITDFESILINGQIDFLIDPKIMSQFYLSLAKDKTLGLQNGLDFIKMAAIYDDPGNMHFEWINNAFINDHFDVNYQPFIDYVNFLVREKSEQLIEGLILQPKQELVCDHLIKLFKGMDKSSEGLSLVNSITALKTIAASLREGDVEKFNSVTNLVTKDHKHTEQLLLYNSYIPLNMEKVRQISSVDVRYRLLALIISRDKIPMQTLSLSHEEIFEIAPYLTYFEWEGELPMDYLCGRSGSLEEILKRCLLLKTLKIIKCSIKEIPDLQKCEFLSCISCDVEKIESLSKCKKLEIRGCRDLPQLPALPCCENFICSSSSIIIIPELSSCISFSCLMCNNVRFIPELPNCQTFACIDCPVQRYQSF